MIKETYRYIWHIMHLRKKSGVSVRNVKFWASKKISPYLELNLEEMNFEELDREGEKYLIHVNPFIRFTDTFTHLLEVNYKKAQKLREALGNLFFHFMANLDAFEGKSTREFELEFLIEDLENGVFGGNIKELLSNFNEVEKYKLAENLHDLYTYDNRMEAYKKGIKKIFNDSIIYDNNFNKEVLVVYINAEETFENKKKLELINILFLPLGMKLRVFWKYHFGIVGLDVTMKVGNMSIY